MKKFISILIALCLVIHLPLLTIHAYEIVDDLQEAVLEEDLYTAEEVIEMACEIWPQYAEKLIAGPEGTVTSPCGFGDERTVVVSEVHEISDTQSIQYVEYSNGLSVASLGYWTESSSTAISGGKTVMGSLVIASGMHVSHLMAFTYTINYSDYDSIDSFGTFYDSNVMRYNQGQNEQETATEVAYYTYQVYFTDSLGLLYGSVIANLTVAKDQFTWSVA